MNIIIFLMAIVFAVAVVIIGSNTRHVSFGTAKKMVMKKRSIKAWTIIATVFFTVIGAVLIQSASNSLGKAVITLNYDDASNALNSNGTRFDMAEIICDEVVERAIEKGAFENVTTEELARCLSVAPAVQGNSYDENNYHIATEFNLYYQADKNTGHLDAENVVQMIGDSFKEFYIDKYAYDFSSLSIEKNSEEIFKSLDYLDIVDYLTKKAERVSNYMYMLAEENPSFTSSSGETFSSLAEKVQNLNKNQIGNTLESYITHNGISKNAPDYVKRLEYSNMLRGYDKQRAEASFNVRNDAVSRYSSEMTRAVLIPTWDKNGEFYMGRTKVGIDELSVDAQNYSKQAEDYYKEIESNKILAERLGTTSVGSGQNATVDKMVSEVNKDLEELTKEARKIGQEYSETKMNKCTSTSVEYRSFFNKLVQCMMILVITFIAFNILAIALAVKKECKEGVVEDNKFASGGEM